MSYVKLSPPRLHQALIRPRLVDQLDSLLEAHPVLWIAGPPGAGKTTLVASYLQDYQAPVHWLRVDPSDNDPATLFLYLTRMQPEQAHSLPAYTPCADGALTDSALTDFARHFFREFYAARSAGSLLVLDNVHCLNTPTGTLLLEIAFEEVPPNLHVIALSRTELPARLARQSLNGSIVTMGWEALRFNQEETRTLVRIDRPPNGHEQAWLDKLQGWATGAVLLSQSSTTPTDHWPSQEQQEACWRYFSDEIFDRLPADDQQALLKLSFLPEFSAADAYLISETPAVIRLIRQMVQDHQFIERRPQSADRYAFHALFREFLQGESRNQLPAQQRTHVLQRAAAMFEARDELASAVQMQREAGAYHDLAGLLKRCADKMLELGREQDWRHWAASLPAPILEDEPWLLYWMGMSQRQDAPQSALQVFERAKNIFDARTDRIASLMTMAAIVDTYYVGMSDLAGMAPWIAAITAQLSELDANELDAEAALFIYSRLTIANMLAYPDSPAIASYAKKSAHILAEVNKPSAAMSAGAILLHCMEWLDADTCQWLATELGGQIDDPSISPLVRGWWCVRAALWHVYFDGNLHLALAINEKGLQLAAQKNLTRLQFQSMYNKALILLAMCDLDATLPLLNSLKPHISPLRKLDIARFATLEANYCIQLGDIDKGLSIANEAAELTAKAGLPGNASPRFDRYIATCFAQSGQFELADAWYQRALAHKGSQHVHESLQERDLVRALALAQSGHAHEAMPLLQAALSTHRQQGRMAFFVRFPLLAANIAALALDKEIEKDHVRSIIKRQGLRAPGPFCTNWPWPVAVRTLGKISLSLNGDLLAFSGKVQQKPLVLLKALLLAPDSGQTLQQIADYLWPDVADARASLNVTIHRLRKLLGNDDAVTVAAGKLSLNRDLVWTDIDALSDLCKRIYQLEPTVAPEELNRLASRLLGLYRGPFSDGNDESWLLSGRHLWSHRFLEAATHLGQKLEKQQQLPMANTLYLRALEVEPLAETLYRSLMRCAHAGNDPSAAFSAYRRCRETLSVILGKRPSAETEKLAVSIGLIDLR